MFCERFYKLCINNGKTPLAVVKDLSIATGSITKWKNGTMPNCESLIKISNYFEASVDYLLGRTDRSELLLPDEVQLLEAYNSSPYVKNAVNGLFGIGNIKQIPINKDDSLKTYAVAFGGQTKQGEITQTEEEKISRLARIVEEQQRAKKDKKD